MVGWRTRPGRWRAIVAVVALYAVALQGFLAGMRPPAIALDALCAPDRAHAPGQDAERHEACCLTPSRCAFAGPATLPVARPERAIAPIRHARTDAGVRPSTRQGPFGARGPPAA
jgi:hypothetical protein